MTNVTDRLKAAVLVRFLLNQVYLRKMLQNVRELIRKRRADFTGVNKYSEIPERTRDVKPVKSRECRRGKNSRKSFIFYRKLAPPQNLR